MLKEVDIEVSDAIVFNILYAYDVILITNSVMGIQLLLHGFAKNGILL